MKLATIIYIACILTLFFGVLFRDNLPRQHKIMCDRITTQSVIYICIYIASFGKSVIGIVSFAGYLAVVLGTNKRIAANISIGRCAKKDRFIDTAALHTRI